MASLSFTLRDFTHSEITSRALISTQSCSDCPLSVDGEDKTLIYLEYGFHHCFWLTMTKNAVILIRQQCRASIWVTDMNDTSNSAAFRWKLCITFGMPPHTTRLKRKVYCVCRVGAHYTNHRQAASITRSSSSLIIETILKFLFTKKTT